MFGVGPWAFGWNACSLHWGVQQLLKQRPEFTFAQLETWCKDELLSSDSLNLIGHHGCFGYLRGEQLPRYWRLKDLKLSLHQFGMLQDVTRILSKQLVKAFLLYKPTVRPSQDSISCSMTWSIYPHFRMKPDECIHGAIMEHVQKVIGVKYSEYWHWQTSFLLRCYTRANHSDVTRPLIGIHSTLLGFSTSHILVGVPPDFFHHNQKARNLKEAFPWQCRMTNENKCSSTGWREDLVWMLRRSPTCNTISNNGFGFLL